MAAPIQAKRESVLFVCKGNTCRSPMAAIILRQLLEDRGLMEHWTVDSAGVVDISVGWETNPRSNYQLEKNGLKKSTHISKKITEQDYENFHFIFGFDECSLQELLARKPASSTSVIRLLGEMDPKGDPIITDPYRGDDVAYGKAFDQIKQCVTLFVNDVLGETNS